MIIRHTISALLLSLAALTSIRAADRVELLDTPFLELVRDPVVHRELQLNPMQVSAIRSVTDRYDAQLFATRNRREDQRRKLVHELVQRVRPRLKSILSPRQLTRLSQIELQWQGPRALLRPEIQARLLLNKPQLDAIVSEVNSTDKAVRDAWKKIQKGRPRNTVQKQIQRIKSGEGRKILGRLTTDQRGRWKSLCGQPLPLNKLGQDLRYKAPEFPTGMKWLNSSPLTMASLRGKVVVLHFYAFG